MYVYIYIYIYTNCRYSIVVRRLDRGAKFPGSTPAVVNYTSSASGTSSLWGSAFAHGATTGQPVQELEWKTRRVKTIYIYIYIHIHIHIMYIMRPCRGRSGQAAGGQSTRPSMTCEPCLRRNVNPGAPWRASLRMERKQKNNEHSAYCYLNFEVTVRNILRALLDFYFN